MFQRLGGVGEEERIRSQGGVDLGEDVVEGGGGPPERVSDRVPLGDELVDGVLEGGQVSEVGRAESFASEDPKPLLHGVHPGAVDRREVGDEARVSGEPLAHQLAVMDRHVVGEEMDRGDRGWDGVIEVLQEGEILQLALAADGQTVDAPGTGVEGGEQMGGTSPLVLMLDLDRSARLSRAGGDATGTWLERGHLVEAQDHFVPGEGAREQVGDGANPLGEGRVARGAWMEPDVLPPGLQPVSGQDPLHRLGRDRRHHGIFDQLPHQFGTVPLAQRAAGFLGQLTSESD